MVETWGQRRVASIHRTHQKLGKVIRVSPNQVLFNDPRAIPEIYGHLQARKFEKDTFYDKVGFLSSERLCALLTDFRSLATDITILLRSETTINMPGSGDIWPIRSL